MHKQSKTGTKTSGKPPNIHAFIKMATKIPNAKANKRSNRPKNMADDLSWRWNVEVAFVSSDIFRNNG